MVRLDEFTANVVASGLVPAEVVGHVQAQLEPEPADDAAVRLARRLIEGRWLTTYQARKLLAGATRGFFLGGYRLVRPLGEGGMGKVYLATNDQKETVAIKVLPPRKALEEENALRRFRREMDLSRRCVHPNLARTLAVGKRGRRPLHGDGVHPRQEPVRAGQERARRPAARPRRGPAVPQADRRTRGGPRVRA